ncbi:MAG: o-succinylbenzoate synthase [Candidatus Hydrogenedentes bacterium]|nr:o-succinylbenzoate synthase [Candidatus Hydrogenedentota bacterium]
MRHASARIFHYRIPLVRPLRLHEEVITLRQGLVVELRGPLGEAGYGDIAPLPGFSEERFAAAYDQACRVLEELVNRRPVPGDAAFPSLRNREKLFPSVRFGIETAMLGLQASMLGTTPARLLHEEPPESVPVCALLIHEGDAAAKEATACARRGFEAVKLKVGRSSMESDLYTVRAVASALPPEVTLRLDANRAWRFSDAVAFGQSIRDMNVEYIEEPLTEPARLPEFHRETGVPYAVDETLAEVGWTVATVLYERGQHIIDANEQHPQRALIVSAHHAHAWIVKPTLLGPPPRAFQGWASTTGTKKRLVVSSSFESGVGLVTLANMAASAGVAGMPAGLDTQAWFTADVVEAPLPVRGGRIFLDEANVLLKSLRADTLLEIGRA